MQPSYQEKRPICRTVFRPVLTKIPSLLEDLQGLPPWNWCDRCGGEVYDPEKTICKTCLEDLED